MMKSEIVRKILQNIIAAPYGTDFITAEEVKKCIPNLMGQYKGPIDGHVLTNEEIEIDFYDLFDIDSEVWDEIEASSTHFFDTSETAAMCLGLPFNIHKKIRTYSGLLNEFSESALSIKQNVIFRGPILDEYLNHRYVVTIPTGEALYSKDFNDKHVIWWHVIGGAGICYGEEISKGSNGLFGNIPGIDDEPVVIENTSDCELVIYLVDKLFN